MMKLKITKQIFIFLFSTYFLLGIFIYFNQTNLLFYPNSQNFNNCNNLEYTQKVTQNTTRFYFYKDKINTNDLIIYYHGNAGSACDRYALANNFKNNNLSFLFVEYSGYSNSSIKINQNNLDQNIIDTIEFTKSQNYSNIILGGTSLGASFATKHANLQTPQKIFLISPYDSLVNLAQNKRKIYPIKLLLKYEFNNIKNLQNYQNEIIIYHGNKDKIIPHKFSQNLYKTLNTKNKQYKLINNAGHNNIHTQKLYSELISEFIIN